MKKQYLNLSVAAALALALVSCNGGNNASGEGAEESNTTDNTEQTATEATPEEGQMPMPEGEKEAFTVDTENSVVRWEGGTAGAQVYSHHGEIELSKGFFQVIADQVVGGKFVIDMTTIEPKDDGYSEEHPASDLVAHLGSPDFFDVENHPTATFEVTGSEGLEVFGDLTIRGITKKGHLHVDMMERQPDGLKVAGTMEFNRQEFNVAWKHYMKDVVLSDIIMLHFEISAIPAK